MPKKNSLTEKIELYQMFIKEKKIGPTSIPSYLRDIENTKKYLKLLIEGKMTPLKFDKITDRDKWDIYRSKLLKGVIWCCKQCKNKLGKELPASPFFDGESVHCSNCDAMLTRRTSGGQSNPFNYSFIKS